MEQPYQLTIFPEKAQQDVLGFYVRRAKVAGLIAGGENRSACLLGVPLEHWSYSGAIILRLPRFQYRYPGTPISTIAALPRASVGRWIIVLSVQVTPTRI